MHPVVGALSAAVMIGAVSYFVGSKPNPGVVAGFMLIGVGIGLVVARYGKVGPFQGEFGSPWFEANLNELLRKEVARAARFDRELTVAVVKHRAGTEIDWTSQVRQADDVIPCRNGWYVLLLPETPKDSAHLLIERATAGSDTEVQAVIMDPRGTHPASRMLSDTLLDLIRNPPVMENRPVIVRRDTDRLRRPAG